jgi:Xaa-Pro aminopeptidase
MENNLYSQRIDKLRALLSPNDAALITDEINVGYFSGFQHSEGVMLITSTKSYLLVDFRYIEAAQKFAVNCKVICFKKLIDDLSGLIVENSIKNIYVESSKLSISRYQSYKQAFDKLGIECDCSSSLDNKIAEIRIIKDASEYQKILKAQQITEQAYLEVLNYIKSGVSERKIALELEYLMKQKGAQDVSFDLITITGQKTSLPHGVPTDDIIKEGDFFTLDIGAVFDGYHSDTTRTVAVGYADEDMKKVYNIVLSAQLAALSRVKEGTACIEVDNAARDIIKNEGYAEFFGHATGHGVGLEIHESPTVSFRSDLALKEGMVITVEPGIYLPKRFGVRIEDMVYVTKESYKNFVSLPKDLIIV